MAKKKAPKEVDVEVIPAEKGGIDLSLILELVGVVMSSTKKGEGQAGFAIDPKKLAFGVAGLAGQQGIQRFGKLRKRRQLTKELKAGLIDVSDFKAGRSAAEKKNKKNRFGPGVLVGSAIGGAVYLLSMSPEDRTHFFQQLDEAFSQAAGFINELQGKPYSTDYETPKPKEV